MGTFTFLGTGSSVGIPVIGCRCSVCSSANSKNKRLRPSGLVQIEGKFFVIDAGPDFRQQALMYKIDHLDGVLLTHTHYDHIAGIDDVRAYSFGKKNPPMPCLLSQNTLDILKERYHYLFRPPQFRWQILEEEEVDFMGVKIRGFQYVQGSMTVTGFRFGDFAYVSDIRNYEDHIFSALQGVKKMVISASRREATRAHFSLSEAVAFVDRAGVEQAWITHISHALDHDEGTRLLPGHIFMGFDGLTIEF